MKKYLITGCAGFIGSNFVYYMLKKYDDILLVNLDKLTYAGNLENLKGVKGDPRHVFVQGDICDKELVSGLFAEYDFNYVINFAAESHVDRSIANPEIFVQTNVMGTVNLLQRAKEAWYDSEKKTWKEGKKYLQVSTDEVYGALGEEGFFMETTPINPHSPYSSSKASADHFVKTFHDTYGMPINITRCSNNYGPYQFPEKLIPLMINNVKHHKQLPVYGDGMQIRDWLYVEDHCKAIDMVANGGSKWHGEILSEENKKQFLIPRGFAHGFLVLSDTAEFCYKCDDFYHPNDEGGMAWNDPEIGIEWPMLEGEYNGTASAEGYTVDGTPLNLSDKDQKWFGLKDTFKF